jgi:hypothetical protein
MVHNRWISRETIPKDRRQRVAIERFAKRAGFDIVDWFDDAAVSGADPIDARPGFSAALAPIAGNGAKTIIVETANRFARDLMVQEVGFAMLRDLGVTLIAADSPSSFPGGGLRLSLARPAVRPLEQRGSPPVRIRVSPARKWKRKAASFPDVARAFLSLMD